MNFWAVRLRPRVPTNKKFIIMEKIYKTREAARNAAIKCFKENNAVAILDGISGEIIDDYGHIAGLYPSFVVVLSGEILGDNPFGDAWEDFYYEQ